MNKEVDRRILHDKTLKYIGFSLGRHPIRPNHFMQLTVCEIKDEGDIVICCSEGFGKGDLQHAKNLLGKEVSGKCLAPFAKNQLSGEDSMGKLLPELKKMLIAPPFLDWYWLD